MVSMVLWKNKKDNELDPKLFSVTSEKFAKEVADEGGRDKNKGTQLRRFFDEILRLDTEARARKDNWKLIHPRVHMVLAKIAYANGRGLVTKKFVDLMRDGIGQVEDGDDLHALTEFLEAFMGFYKLYNRN